MRGSQLKCGIRSCKLDIDSPDIGGMEDSKLSVATVFLDALVVQSTVETLTMPRDRWFSSLRSSRGPACSFSPFEYFIEYKLCEILRRVHTLNFNMFR